jgi:hypothetical protein
MVNLSTEAFPYTAGYVKELLKVDDAQLIAYAEALSIKPRQDDITGGPVFTHKEVEALKQALDMQTLAQTQPLQQSTGNTQAVAKPYATVLNQAAKQLLSSPQAPQAMGASNQSLTSAVTAVQPTQLPNSEEHNLAVVVEAVSQAKEGILKDLSRLLDDKLSGLDEVVVELIRAKSENDSMTHQITALQSEVNSLKTELGRYKPVQFGFYRKIG